MHRVRHGAALDWTIGVMGTLALVVAALPLLSDPDQISVLDIIVACSVIALGYFPLELPSRAGQALIGFQAVALVFIGLDTSLPAACALWLFGMCASHLFVRGRRWNIRMFNLGCTSLSGLALLDVMAGQWNGWAPPTALAVTLGCAAYFVVDLLLTAVSLMVIDGITASEALPPKQLPLPMAVFVAINSLGYLGALVHRAYRWPALLLLLVPLVTLLVAAQSVSRARASARRQDAVLRLTDGQEHSAVPVDVRLQLLTELRELMPIREVELRDRAPRDDEIGSELPTGQDGREWVVVGHGRGARRFTDGEEQAVRVLVAVAGETLQRQRLLVRMSSMARLDSLTGLANRASFSERLDEIVAQDAPGKVAVLYCDLDGFKGVNDRFGHLVGDEVLVEIGRRMQRECPSDATLARLGGDEFAIVLEGTQAVPEAAVETAHRLVAAVSEPVLVRDHTARLGLSVGIAHGDHGGQLEALVQMADTAMYGAKSAGKNRVEVGDDRMREITERRLLMEDELVRVVEDGGLSLALQPVVEVATGATDGFESLLRWEHPTLGSVPPIDTLAVAERLGLSRRIGRWVIAEAYRQALIVADAAGRRVSVGVNVAADQLADEQFLSLAETFAADRRIHLVLELTEHALIDEDVAEQALRRIHEAGADIAIDDFGVGYSSVRYLHRFEHIRIVKVDRSFVADMLGNDRARGLVGGVIAMAKAFGATVVAEGVEDLETARLLAELDCPLVQGYLFGRPMPLAALCDRLRAERGAAAGAVPPSQRSGGGDPVLDGRPEHRQGDRAVV